MVIAYWSAWSVVIDAARGPETGAEGRDRTGDTVIFSHVLYQLSYLGTADDSIGSSDSGLGYRP